MNIFDRKLALSGGVLHHIGLLLAQDEARAARALERPVSRCAWCDAETGRTPDPRLNESHSICTRHLAGIESNLESLRRQSVSFFSADAINRGQDSSTVHSAAPSGARQWGVSPMGKTPHCERKEVA